MTEEQQAILLFEKQKEKIKDLKPNTEEFWRQGTANLIERCIGKDFYLYDKILGHVFKPNGPHETIESQRERGEAMIDGCIDHIKSYGIKKQEPIDGLGGTTNITIHGDAHNSDFSQDNRRHKQITKIKTPQTISKKPSIEKWGLWVAISVGIITLLTGLKTCGYL